MEEKKKEKKKKKKRKKKKKNTISVCHKRGDGQRKRKSGVTKSSELGGWALRFGRRPALSSNHSEEKEAELTRDGGQTSSLPKQTVVGAEAKLFPQEERSHGRPSNQKLVALLLEKKLGEEKSARQAYRPNTY